MRPVDCRWKVSATPFGGFGTDSPPHQPPSASRTPVAATTTTLCGYRETRGSNGWRLKRGMGYSRRAGGLLAMTRCDSTHFG